MNTRIKRMVLPLGGVVAASALLGASLVTSAAAAAPSIKSSEYLAQTPAEAYSVAEFWLGANSAALKKATEYHYDYKLVGDKLQVKGGPSADSKPGTTAPAGGAVTATKTKNINLPKTIGKVFWVDSKGEYKWASGSAIQSRYGNVVATAGHAVYDDKANGQTLDKWVFVPGYYQGKAPWGVYVGKQAWTHYDFAVYEDYDKDYAFVNVYNGFKIGADEEVSKDAYDAWTGDKWVDSKEITRAEYKAIKDKYGPLAPIWVDKKTGFENVGPTYPGALLDKVEVTEAAYNAAAAANINANGAKYGSPQLYALTEAEYNQLLADKANGKVLGKVWKGPITGSYYLTRYYVKQYVKDTKDVKFYLDYFYIGKVTDVGTLSSNVGGQGFAWNQPRGKTVFAFGYPKAEHADGNAPYTGVTPKWSYGKTYTAVKTSVKAEESIGLKSAMTGGADGGPWIWQYSSAKRVGYINGVTSWFGDNDNNNRIDFIASPYFDGETKAIYDAAYNAWSGKIVGPQGQILK